MFCVTKLVSRYLLPQTSLSTASTPLNFVSAGLRREFSDRRQRRAAEEFAIFILRRGAASYSSQSPNMSYFVIGVSGVTCGGKTTMSKLLQKSFPWCRVIHQDKYFYPEDYPGHVLMPEIGNHINFDRWSALDMDQMHRDVEKILWSPPDGNEANGLGRNGEIAPNFAEGVELLRNLRDIEVNTAKYANISILIIEGFTMFESEDLYDKCDIRFFLTLDEETCRHRRSLRVFDPPDGKGYFDHCIWPEYQRHHKHFIEDRNGIHVFSGKSEIGKLWKDSVELIMNKMDEKFAYKLNQAKERF